MRNLAKRLLPIAIFVICVIFIWSGLYYYLGILNGANWSFIDCFYMTVMHISPRAIAEALPNMGMAGRFLTLFLLFIGLGAMMYLVSQLTSFIIEGRFSEMYRRKSMLKQIAKLRNHFVICGANKVSQQVISEMLKREINFVVIESNHDMLQDACSLGDFFYIEADPTTDDALISAGIKVARGIVIVTPSDETNLYITFAAHELNPSVRVISRVADSKAASRLTRAGAHSVINPDYIGGLRMVSEAIRPSVVSFLDIMMRDTQSSFRIDQTVIQKGSPIEDKSLKEANIEQQSGALVLALAKQGQSGFIYNPSHDIRLEAGTTIVTLADVNQIKKLKQLTSDEESFVKPVME